MENKNWYRSLTIVPLVIIMILISITVYMVMSIPTLDYDFTTDELCDWAYATSRNQKILILQMLIVSCAIISIYGRIRAKKGIGGKNGKK